MLAVQYTKSVPRYFAARWLGPRMPSLYASRLGAARLARIEPPGLPTQEWLRVRPLLSGICGSDLATVTAKGSAYFSPLTSCPFVLGHEVVGVVEAKGREAGDWEVGQRVILEPPLNCRVRGISNSCPQCRSGHPSRCENIHGGSLAAGIQTGFCRDTGGGWSESLVAHRDQLHAAPSGAPDSAAVLTEPLACALQAVLNAPLESDGTVIVLGCGSIGALTILAARKMGFRGRLIAVARHEHQRRAAQRYGADEVVGTRNLRRQMADLLGAKVYQPELGGPVHVGGADLCFDCVGSARSLDDSLRFARSGGTVMVVGMPGVPRNVDWTAIWFKELRIIGSYTSEPATFRRALGMVPTMLPELEGFVGAVYPLSAYAAALASALNTGASGVLKTALRPETRT